MLGHQFEEDETKEPGISDICSTMSVLRRVGWGLGWFGGGSNMDRVCGESQSVPTICSKTCLPSIDRVCSVQLLRRCKLCCSLRFPKKICWARTCPINKNASSRIRSARLVFSGLSWYVLHETCASQDQTLSDMHQTTQDTTRYAQDTTRHSSDTPSHNHTFIRHHQT